LTPPVTAAKRPIRVMIVDDSALVRQVLTSMLGRESDLAVSTSANAVIALGKVKKERPDVILLDLEMPEMDGLAFLEKVMAEDPIPVVVCSGYAGKGSEKALRALDLGAVEIVNKPQVGIQEFLFESALMIADVVRAAAQAKLRPRKSYPVIVSAPKLTADAILPPPSKWTATGCSSTVVAVGASTGGTEALPALLRVMPKEAPGIVVVQHMPEGFTLAFARRLDGLCRMEVREATDGDEILKGLALLAPGNRHLLVKLRSGRLFVEVVEGPLVARHRPSVDVLFRSVASAAGPNAVGILLTGMGDDGADGLLEMRQAGAATIAQDEATSVVFGMPKAAIERGAAESILGLPAIPAAILRLGR
jgi:two-component system, chemotaxis family, protein-glutamate methylesterase/glutaminase